MSKNLPDTAMTYHDNFDAIEKQNDKRSESSWGCFSTSNPLVRILAVIGLLVLIQNVIYHIGWTQIGETDTLEIPHAFVPHEIDEILTHHVHGTGVSKYGSKAIVAASRSSENTSWFQEFFPDWQLNIYVVDEAKANLTILQQGGNEAAVYLTYIINHYHNLPDITIFHHAKRFQWHSDDPEGDSVNPIKNLKLPFVQQQGYVNLRCCNDPGCLPSATATRHDSILARMTTLWPEWFPERPMPSEIATGCCAQFAVTKEQIRKRPIIQYERIRQWLWTQRDMNAYMAGQTLEYTWHVVLSRPNVDCMVAKTCYCQKFGLCDLSCKDDNYCDLKSPELA